MKSRKQRFVIYKIDRKGRVIYDTVECIKPHLTKYYKQCKDDFVHTDLYHTFGYITQDELLKSNLWVTPSHRIEVYIVE